VLLFSYFLFFEQKNMNAVGAPIQLCKAGGGVCVPGDCVCEIKGLLAAVGRWLLAFGLWQSGKPGQTLSITPPKPKAKGQRLKAKCQPLA